MSESNSSSGGGIGVLGLLGVVFVVLKLTHVIAWSWWWVTLPFWGGFALVVLILGGALCVTAIGEALSRRAQRRRIGAR